MPSAYITENEDDDTDPANSAEAICQSNMLARRLMEQLTYTSEIAGYNTTIVAWFMIIELLAALAVHIDADPDETLNYLRDWVDERVTELRSETDTDTVH